MERLKCSRPLKHDVCYLGEVATDKDYLQYILDQIGPARPVNSKMMFGEYGLFAEDKMFAVVCDNKLFFKPTNRGRAFIGDVVEAPPYPGAKNYFLIEDKLEDRKWLGQLIEMTIAELPMPKKRKKKKKQS